MKINNMPIEQFIEYIQNKKIYIYGVGDFYKRLTQKIIYKDIHKNVDGYIDNGRVGEKINVFNCQYDIQGIHCMKRIEKGVILLCSTKYLEEMFTQLDELKLPDSIECFIMPFIWAVTDGIDNLEIMNRLYGENHNKILIERKIHCFWFSGEKKPDKYQRCIDTWKKTCPNYQIIEWNADTYNWQKNVFMRQAFEKKKWAFVSDYARLDVIYNYGGIYLDMDVELLKDFEPLLQFEAFFNYGTRHMIELGSGFGAKRYNHFVGSLLKLYENEEFLDKDGIPQTNKFVQPVWLNNSFYKEGFRLNGSMQLLKNMLLLPRRFYTPKDDILLCNCLQCKDTRGIHHFNSEWQPKEYLEQRNSSDVFYNFCNKVSGGI